MIASPGISALVKRHGRTETNPFYNLTSHHRCVSNYRQHEGKHERNHQRSALLVLCEGIHRSRSVMRKVCPCNDAIMNLITLLCLEEFECAEVCQAMSLLSSIAGLLSIHMYTGVVAESYLKMLVVPLYNFSTLLSVNYGDIILQKVFLNKKIQPRNYEKFLPSNATIIRY